MNIMQVQLDQLVTDIDTLFYEKTSLQNQVACLEAQTSIIQSAMVRTEEIVTDMVNRVVTLEEQEFTTEVNLGGYGIDICEQSPTDSYDKAMSIV